MVGALPYLTYPGMGYWVLTLYPAQVTLAKTEF